MTYQFLLHTLCHLKGKQIFYQILYRLHKSSYKQFDLQNTFKPLLFSDFIEKYSCLDLKGEKAIFEFINIPTVYSDWNETKNGMLWAYNLNYMDWLGQSGMTFLNGKFWINRFIVDLPQNKVGLDSYPIALRSINWIKFISKNYPKISKEEKKDWDISLYSQVKLLEHKLEYHLLGNHLLEDWYALFIASLYFQDVTLYAKASKGLVKELDEEILSDGMHYEQSPMYHCILLDRLLDCYNISLHNIYFPNQEKVNARLLSKAKDMLGHLSAIVYADGSIPLFNDSALGIAPTSHQIFDYASRLGISFVQNPLRECGYRHLKNQKFESIVDVGNITATYQPGHTHADTFNYELRVNGIPFIVDTGISTYNKTNRRQYERGTSAHNTVSIGGRDSSEVWGGFRVGRRAKVQLLDEGDETITALHDGFGKENIHQRTFRLSENNFEISDFLSNHAEAVSYIHLAPQVQIIKVNNNLVKTDVADIQIMGATSVEVADEKISKDYNRFLEIKVVKIHFEKVSKYIIS